MPRAALVLGALTILLASCLPRTPAFELPVPGEIEALERRVGTDSTDVDALVALAASRLAAADAEQATRLLDVALVSAPDDPAATLLRGVALEESGRPLEAANQYRAYMDLHPGPMVRRAMARLDGVAIEATREVARRSLASTPTEPQGRRVVVLPFAHEGSPTEEELTSAVATLASRDVTGRGWSVVDPRLARILLSEAGIRPTERAEYEVARRVAGAVGASHVVRGRFIQTDPDLVEWRVAVDDFTREDSTTLALVTVRLAPDQMVELEQRVGGILSGALFRGDPDAHDDVYHTSDRFALLEYGRGLIAWDAGVVSDAISAFEGAVTRDPDFGEASDWVTRLRSVEAIRDGERADQIVEIARLGELRRVLVAARTDPAGTPGAAIGAGGRPFVADLLGLDRLGAGPALEIRFTLPGGLR